MESFHWRMWKENIGVKQIHCDWSILAFAAKWLDCPEVIYRDTGGRGAEHVRDDKPLLHSLWSLLDAADVVITQNGKRFDIPKINARLIEHGFRPYSPIKQVDTRLVAKVTFGFSSTRLAYLSDKLTDTPKDEHKLFPDFDLWRECLKDNHEAWAEMRKYNCRDVEATEAVYLKMRPWVIGHPNVAAYVLGEEIMCPRCGSEKMQKAGLWNTQTGEYTRYRCDDCGGWARTRYTENSTGKRKSLLSN